MFLQIFTLQAAGIIVQMIGAGRMAGRAVLFAGGAGTGNPEFSPGFHLTFDRKNSSCSCYRSRTRSKGPILSNDRF